MYNLKEVSQVNKKYIFFVFSDGTQERKAVNVNKLTSCAISDLKNNGN